jgi:hypothetical protein
MDRSKWERIPATGENSLNGEKHLGLLQSLEDSKVDESLSEIPFIGKALSLFETPEYTFPRKFHNDRVDEVKSQLSRPRGWEAHVNQDWQFAPGYNRDVYRNAIDSKYHKQMLDERASDDRKGSGPDPRKAMKIDGDHPSLFGSFFRSLIK